MRIHMALAENAQINAVFQNVMDYLEKKRALYILLEETCEELFKLIRELPPTEKRQLINQIIEEFTKIIKETKETKKAGTANQLRPPWGQMRKVIKEVIDDLTATGQFVSIPNVLARIHVNYPGALRTSLHKYFMDFTKAGELEIITKGDKRNPTVYRKVSDWK